jgi:hypothetical protein
MRGGSSDFHLEVKHRRGVEDFEKLVQQGIQSDEELVKLQEIRSMLFAADQQLCLIGDHYIAHQNARKLEIAKQQEKRIDLEKRQGKVELNTTYERLFTNASGDMKAVFATDPMLMKFAHHAPAQTNGLSQVLQPKPPPRR